ncbi:hypothetical protein JCM8097_000266 [Rhodosporidiobolus ruineniae]
MAAQPPHSAPSTAPSHPTHNSTNTTKQQQGKHGRPQDSYPSPPNAPPTPAATSSGSPPLPSTSSARSGSIPLPSFISADPLSSDPDSSSDEDGFGYPKPAKPPRTSKSTGLPRPRPSYYYDADYDPGTAGNKKRGRRGGYKGVPVFEPTMEDFEGNGGFYGYVKRIEKYGMRSGIVKVIPPKEWSNDLPSVLPPLRDIRLREPIEQHMMGSQGLYRVTNVAKTRIWNAAQWKDLAVRDKWEGPDPLGEKEKRGERSERKVLTRKEREAEKRRMKQEEEEAEADGEFDEDDEGGDGETPKKGRRTPAKRATPAGKGKGKEVKLEDEDGDEKPALDDPSRSSTATPAPFLSGADPSASTSATPDLKPSKKRPSNQERAVPTDAEWAAFSAQFEALPHGMKKEDYTVELMRDFERRYWRTLTFGEPPMYGADMAGSLFSDSTKAWNVAHLGDLLPKLAPGACSIPGVVSPYLYFGMWRATFAWHVEDADLYSINYIHFGAPKFWYSVPQEQAAKFERVMEGFFPTDFRKCHEFLRHKAFLASPRVLSNSGITLNRCAQLPGEFILTYPKGYHSGFNLGFNCAESINFATERWLPIGKVAKHCLCIDDSVNIDVNIWLREAAKAEALSKGEPWPYDDDLPSSYAAAAAPPAAAGKKRMAIASSSAPAPKKPKPAPPAQQQPQFVLAPEARAQLAALLQQHGGILPPQLEYLNPYIPYLYAPYPSAPPAGPAPQSMAYRQQQAQENPYARSSYVYSSTAQSGAGQARPPQPRAPSMAKSASSSGAARPSPAPAAIAAPPPAPAAPPAPAFVCALCPDLSEDGLVRVGEPGAGGGKKAREAALRAHRVCVMFTPATWIETDPQTGEELVRGYAKIEKARWKLKCQLCVEPHGTKIQCTKGKCTKAFHVTCALKDDSGIYMDAAVPSGDVESGEMVSILDAAVDAEPSKGIPNNDLISLTVLCRTHNPEYQQREQERKAAELRAKVDALPPRARIKVRTSGGAFDVTLDEVDREKEMVSFVFDDGKRNVVKWKLIIWPENPEVARKKLEKQQRAEQAKAAVLDRPKYTNRAKRLSSASTAAPVAAVAAVAQPAPVPAAAAAPTSQPHPQPQPRGNYYSQPAPTAASSASRPPLPQQHSPYPTPPQPHYSPQPSPYAAAPHPHPSSTSAAQPSRPHPFAPNANMGHYPYPAHQHAYYAALAAKQAQAAQSVPHGHPAHPTSHISQPGRQYLEQQLHQHQHPQTQHGSPYGSPVMQHHPSPPMQQQQQARPPYSSYAAAQAHGHEPAPQQYPPAGMQQ